MLGSLGCTGVSQTVPQAEGAADLREDNCKSEVPSMVKVWIRCGGRSVSDYAQDKARKNLWSPLQSLAAGMWVQRSPHHSSVSWDLHKASQSSMAGFHILLGLEQGFSTLAPLILGPDNLFS